MKKLKQLAALLQMNLGSLPQQLSSVLVTVIGIACVVGVLVAMLSMSVTAHQNAMKNVRADRVEFGLKPGASFDNASLHAVMDMPGIVKDADGKPLAAAATVAGATVRRKIDNVRTSTAVFGIDPQYFKVFPELRVTAGRRFQPAVYELIVGKTRRLQSSGLEIGDHLRLRGAEWTIVGQFEYDGGGIESFLLGDLDTVKAAYQLNAATWVTAVIETPAAFATVQKAIAANPTLSNVELKHEAESREETSKGIIGILDFVSYFVGAVMAIGATLGAINVMYSLVDNRKRETATLRAIGFGAGPIVISVLIESLLLALPGALLGVLLAWALFNGAAVSPLGASLKLTITPALAMVGVSWALVMGLIGGLTPAVRAARVPVATALRAT